jgi:hypothetical protein
LIVGTPPSAQLNGWTQIFPSKERQTARRRLSAKAKAKHDGKNADHERSDATIIILEKCTAVDCRSRKLTAVIMDDMNTASSWARISPKKRQSPAARHDALTSSRVDLNQSTHN